MSGKIMDKDKKTLIIFIILVVIGIFIYWPNNKNQKKKIAVSATAAVVKAPEEIDKKKIIELMAAPYDNKKTKENSLILEWGERNPFDTSSFKAMLQNSGAVRTETVLSKVNLVLMGVLWGGLKPSAVINDKVVGVGDIIEGLTVKWIGESTVILTNGNQEVTLTMWQ